MTFSVLQYGVAQANSSTISPTTLQPPAPLVISSNSSGAALSTASGSTLLLFAGVDVSTTATSAPVPSFSVTDSAGNLWLPLSLSSSSFSAARGTVWVAFNALPVKWISATPNAYCATAIAVGVEFGGMQTLPQIDFIAVPTTTASGSTLAVSGTATQADVVFTMVAAGNSGYTSFTVPAGWTACFPAQTPNALADPNGLGLCAAWETVSAAGAVSATWGVGAASPMCALMVGFSQAQGPLPVQPNPSFPKVRVELGFGASPADPTSNFGIYNTGTLPVPTYMTDVSARAIGSAGGQSIQGTRGKTYELADPEAGTCTIGMNNWDGAFNPTNASSPYYPNVLLNTPMRLTAWWSGRWYPMFQGFVAKFPQDWPDLPQFGLSAMQCVDMCSIASTVNLPSALQGEILADEPYACFPFNEQYTVSAQQTTVVGGVSEATAEVVQAPTECSGLIAVNTSRINQRTATYIDGGLQNNSGGSLTTTAAAPVITGQTLALLGDAGTGMGCTSYATPQSNFRGPGATYADLSGSAPGLVGTGMVMEAFLNVPVWTAGTYQGAGNTVNLLQAIGPPVLISEVTAPPPYPLAVVQMTYSAGYDISVTVTQNSTTSVTVPAAIPTALMGTTIHVAVALSPTLVTLYVNGASVASAAWVAPTNMPVQGWLFGGARWPFFYNSFNYNFTMGYGTIYGYQLPASRILAHAQAGILGFAGESSLQRFGRLTAWSGVNMNPAAWPQQYGYQVQMGAAYDYAATSLGDALGSLTLTDGGMWFTNKTGNLMFATRQALINQAPSITFGDSNTSGAEIPYEPGFGLDYDNAYLQNIAQTTQENGPATLLAPIEINTTSEKQYFQRGPLAQTIQSTSAQDAFDRTYWNVNKYSQPSTRLRTLSVSAGSKTSVFPACLQVDIGTVATVNRRPMGATATYSLPVLIQQVQFSIGPSVFDFQYVGTPYNVDGAVLQADVSNDVLGSNVLAW